MTIANDFANIIKRLGSDFIFKDGATPRTIRAALVNIGKEDQVLVNALGVEGRILYIQPTTPPPGKFNEAISPTGRVYAVHFIHEIIVDDQLLGFKIGVSG